MSKARILYVEDEAGAARLLKCNLEDMGRYEVAVQVWAEDALATAHVFKPDLILMDQVMPRRQGVELVRDFRNDSEMQHLPILFFTATVKFDPSSVDDGCLAGCPCLAKPASMDGIVAFIERYLPEPLQQRKVLDLSLS